MFLLLFLSLFLKEDKEKAEEIKKSFLFAWNGYKKCAFGSDFLMPVSCQPHHWLNASLSIVDSLDTLYVMGLHEELDEAINYMENNFTFNASGSVFELIIRVVGGLVSAYQFTRKESLLMIAEEFANHLLPAFETETGLPKPNIHFNENIASTWGYSPRSTFLAHAGSLMPEFMTLSQYSDNSVYKMVSDNVLEFLFTSNSFHGLWPSRIDFSTGVFGDIDIGFDAYGDSFYEYLLKLSILTDGKCKSCSTLYKRSIQGMKDFLLRSNSNYTFVGTVKKQNTDDELTHLSYFLPGMLALGSLYFNKSDLELAEKIADTYALWHKSSTTGLSPEAFSLKTGELIITDPSYKLRPEFIESCFYLYRITGKQKWRDIGWELYLSIVKHCKVENGFAELIDVNNPERGHQDVQDSFLLAETFKYAYLLFCNSSYIPLNEYVFTTEGHIIKHFDKEWIEENYQDVPWFSNITRDEGPFIPKKSAL